MKRDQLSGGTRLAGLKDEGRVEGKEGVKAPENGTKLRVQNTGHMVQVVTLVIVTDLRVGEGWHRMRQDAGSGCLGVSLGSTIY